MENQLVITLPAEVQELAVKVSEQKKNEVNTVLNQIFAGTADWEKQVDAIEVKGIADKMSINLADVARKNVKSARLSAEKVFDAKRDEVQQIKAEYDLEDKLWLKAKQIMQLKFKAIEEKAEWKANFVQRYEAEQKELRTQLRIEKISKLNPEINRIEFENMTDEMFNIFFSGVEKAFNDKIEAEKKAEAERIAKEKAEAKRIEKIRIENERLKAANEAKAKELKEAEAKAAKEKAIADEKAKQAKIKADAELKAANEAKEKIQAELKAKQDAELKAKKEADLIAAEKLKAEKKAAAAPKKQRLNIWVDGFHLPDFVGLTDDKTVLEIVSKFHAFKAWAKTKIENIE